MPLSLLNYGDHLLRVPTLYRGQAIPSTFILQLSAKESLLSVSPTSSRFGEPLLDNFSTQLHHYLLTSLDIHSHFKTRYGRHKTVFWERAVWSPARILSSRHLPDRSPYLYIQYARYIYHVIFIIYMMTYILRGVIEWLAGNSLHPSNSSPPHMSC